MTPEQESQLFEDIGGIKTGITSLNKLLDIHTTQDMTQFSTMSDALQQVHEKVDKLASDFAVAAAVKEEQDKSVKKIAGIRAAWVSAGIGFVYTLMQIFIPMLWKR